MRLMVGFILVSILAGCSSKPSSPILGTWRSEAKNTVVIWNFDEEGKQMTQVTSEPFHVKASGTYTFEKARLTLTNTTVDVKGPEPKASQARELLKKPSSMTVTVTDQDHLDVLPDGAHAPLKLVRASAATAATEPSGSSGSK